MKAAVVLREPRKTKRMMVALNSYIEHGGVLNIRVCLVRIPHSFLMFSEPDLDPKHQLQLGDMYPMVCK